MKPARCPSLETVTGAFLFLGVGGLYLYMLCPTVPAGDGGELITAAATLGIAHPPGYPLYILLGKLFSLLPFGSVAWRINLMSAWFNAWAVVLAYMTLLQLFPRAQRGQQAQPPGIEPHEAVPPGWRAIFSALLGALFLAFSLPFWRYSLVAEVFALNNFLAALLVFLLLRGRDRKFPFYLWCLLLGLGCSNHHTILFLIPGFAYYLWKVYPEIYRPKMLLAGFGCFCLGLLPYLYLPLAALFHPRLIWEEPNTLTGFLNLVSRKEYGSLVLAPGDTLKHPVWLQLPVWLAFLSRYFSLWGLGLALAGTIYTWRAARKVFWLLLLNFILSGPVFLMIANLNTQRPTFETLISRFYLLPSLALSLWIGAGVFALLNCAAALSRKMRAQAQTPVYALCWVILALLPLNLFYNHYRLANQRGNYTAYDCAANVLRTLPPGTIFIATGDVLVGTMLYLLAVEHQRPDVILMVEKLSHPWYLKYLARQYPGLRLPFTPGAKTRFTLSDLVAANIARHPVRVANILDPFIPDKYLMLPMGLVEEIQPKTTAVPLPRYKQDLRRLWSSYRFDPAKLAGFTNLDFEKNLAHFYAKAYVKTGAFLLQYRDYPEAMAYLHKAAAIYPAYPATYKMLGWACLKSARSAEDLIAGYRYYEQFLNLKPEDPEIPEIENLMRGVRHILLQEYRVTLP